MPHRYGSGFMIDRRLPCNSPSITPVNNSMTYTAESGATLEHLLGTLLDQQRVPCAAGSCRREVESRPDRSEQQVSSSLIPLSHPRLGEQYGFEVDLDACSGCGSCVTACHQLNGLLPSEVWRKTGVLVGGTASQLPVIQPVTTACHHCLEPACMHGCPASAYEKDAETGIVRHIADHCIGCQYCTLTCPYDVPVYNRELGIVRKCDMCHDRLAEGIPPACAAACPHEAIRIRVVDRAEVREESEAGLMLPAAPDPRHTLPTTSFRTSRPWPKNTLPADYFTLRAEDTHTALVVMLVLTQMSVGAFVVELLWHWQAARLDAEITTAIRPFHLASALALGLLGIDAAVFHLGRPRRAWRACLGWRTSWLSREILAFALFSAMASAYVAVSWSRPLHAAIGNVGQGVVGAVAAGTGVAAVFTSVMIYAATRRPLWAFWRTSLDFALTSLVLGTSVTLLIAVIAGSFLPPLSVSGISHPYGRSLGMVLLGAVALRLAFECSLLFHLRDRTLTPRRRAALLVAGPLSMTAFQRLFCGIVGGFVLPLVLLAEKGIAAGGYQAWFPAIVGTLSLGLLTAGELLSRHLFFATSVAPRMPGVPR